MRFRPGRPRRSGRSMPGRPAAAVSSTSTASSAARTTSTTPRCTRAPRRSSRRRPPRRATTSPRTWPITPSTGSGPRRRWRRTSRSSCTSRPAPRTPRTTCRWSGPTSTPGKFAGGWDAQREAILARQKELGVVPADAELTARPTRSRPGTTWTTRSSRCWNARWRSTQGSWSTPTSTSAGSSTPSRPSARWRTRSSTTSSATTAPRPRAPINGAFNEMANFNGLAAIETPEFMASVKDKLGTSRPTTTTRSAGRWAMCAPYQWTKQVASHWGGTRNGTIVHWPDGITQQGRAAVAVQPRHRRRAHHARSGGPPGARLRQRRAAGTDRGHQHDLQLRRRRRSGAPRPAVLRDVRQPRHLLQGLERGHPAQHPVAAGRGPPRARRRRLGALRRQQRLVPVPRPRRRAARTACRTATAVADRGRQVQRAAHRRPPLRTAQPDHRRPTAAHHRHQPDPVPRDETPERAQRHRHQEPVVQRDRGDRAAATDPTNGVLIAQGGRFGGWALYVKEGRAKFVYNLLGMQEFITEATEDLSPPAPTRSEPSSPTTAAASARAATSPSTTTAGPSAPAAWT